MHNGYKLGYGACVALAMLLLTVGAARGWTVSRVDAARAKKEPSVRHGSGRTHYVFVGYGGK